MLSHRAVLCLSCLVVMPVLVVCSGRKESTNDQLAPIPAPAYTDSKDVTCPCACVTSTIPLSAEVSKLDVYATSYTTVDDSYVRNVAQQVRISGNPVFDSSADTYQVTDGGATLVVRGADGSFAILANHGTSDATGISDEKATQIGEDYIHQLGLFPGMQLEPEITFRSSQQIGLHVAPKFPFAYYGIDMYVGGSGQVDWLNYTWPKLKPAGSYPIVSEAEAFQRLQDCEIYKGGRVAWPLKVKQVSIVYMGTPNLVKPDYLIPTYEFTLVNADGQEMARQYVPALSDSYIKATPDSTGAGNGTATP